MVHQEGCTLVTGSIFSPFWAASTQPAVSSKSGNDPFSSLENTSTSFTFTSNDPDLHNATADFATGGGPRRFAGGCFGDHSSQVFVIGEAHRLQLRMHRRTLHRHLERSGAANSASDVSTGDASTDEAGQLLIPGLVPSSATIFNLHLHHLQLL